MMHSCDPVPAAAPPASGPNLLLQLGRLIVRSRSTSPATRAPPHDRLIHAKLLAANPSTSTQVQTQPKPAENEEPKPAVEAKLNTRVQALWDEQIPVCIEVLLAPDCQDCYSSLCRDGDSFEKHAHRALLLERWTMSACVKKGDQSPAFSTSQWLLNAVRSQLHFSQLSAWLARLKNTDESPTERRRKLSRESCNYKKVEANCDDDQSDRKLNVVYSIHVSRDSYKKSDFVRPPNDHKFPVTDIGNNMYLNIILQSLPRLDDIPQIKCTCPKRKTSKDTPPNIHDEIVGKLNDLTIGSKFDNPNVVDDRMLTPCSENGKHKCNCDDESDGNRPKKLDDKRLKEIAKYKRRIRKESKIKKLHDSTSSEGDGLQRAKETHTSIPILQASRFDRFRAIGCYRNQTYLTLPATRIETKSPFIDTDIPPPAEFKKTNTVSTQTEELSCQCGNLLQMTCDTCSDRGMVRSEGNYNLASVDNPQSVQEDEKKIKKHKCDKYCDNNHSISDNSDIIKRPKLRRFFPIVDKIEKIVTDRFAQKDNDMQELQLDKEDTVFSRPRESKRQKTYSINDDDYVFYEKCDYGTFDRVENPEESPKEESPPEVSDKGFKFPDPKKQDNQVPSPTEMDRFRWRFDSAASMVFHTKTGLPLTSSPAPLRRGNNCFDFDDSINGISGIKSALFHPPPAVESPAPESPVSAAPPPPPAPAQSKIKMRPSTGLLGSFEESALKGRLEPVATVHGFTAELGAYGSFCPPHKRLPVTVFFYAPGGTNAPYMGHINLGSRGYRVARSGTVQVSLFNPHGTLVKMFVVLYDLTRMPPHARTFLRQRTLYMPAAAPPPAPAHRHQWLRYLIHLRFMTSKSGKLYLHTDIRIIVSRKADLDTATAHSALFRPLPTNSDPTSSETDPNSSDRKPNRVFGGCSDFDDYENQNGVSYELRSFTYAPDNPKYSPR
ncbi:unnamed protein product [Spodoptera exigua]|nr:unnamed protein product [Spodoptera exigua]